MADSRSVATNGESSASLCLVGHETHPDMEWSSFPTRKVETREPRHVSRARH